MNRKVIAKIAGFLVIFVILLEIFCVIFDGGYWFEKKFIYDRNARMAAFELEPKGQIDLLNVGDSLSTSALAPLELYRLPPRAFSRSRPPSRHSRSRSSCLKGTTCSSGSMNMNSRSLFCRTPCGLFSLSFVFTTSG